jgi:hypothetical protein
MLVLPDPVVAFYVSIVGGFALGLLVLGNRRRPAAK